MRFQTPQFHFQVKNCVHAAALLGCNTESANWCCSTVKQQWFDTFLPAGIENFPKTIVPGYINFVVHCKNQFYILHLLSNLQNSLLVTVPSDPFRTFRSIP